jgi:hypothetical protein
MQIAGHEHRHLAGELQFLTPILALLNHDR